jgi:replicative DNA helicase
MERILRGLMQIGSVPEAEDCLRNWNRLQEYSLDFPTVEDKLIFDYFRTFYNQMSAPPDFAIVREYFEKEDNIEVASRLDEVKAAQPYIGTNYLAIVRAEEDRQQTKSIVMLFRDASMIAEHGRNVDRPVNGKKVLKGVPDAVNYVYDKLHDFTRVEGGEKLEGVVSEDADEFMEEYEVVEKMDKYAGRNLFGLEPVDTVCRGHRMGEYWIHTAFAGELKTSLALNYAYNNAFVYGKNIFYAILEMPYKQLRRQLYVIHSSHGKFVTEWWKEDQKAGIPPEHRYVGLDYRKVRDGELSPRDKERLKKVAQDFKATSRGRLFVWRPSDEATIMDIRRKAEMFHNKYGCDGIVVDHLGLVKPKHRTSDFVTTQNAVVRDGRLMALNFARGRGVPVMALFQMNRQGKLRADKNDGRYDMAAISYANEVEKSADVITWTYLNDQLRKEGKFYMGNLKNRDNPMFDRMIGKILWMSKRMRAIESGLIDMDNDRLIVSAGEHISQLTAADLMI